MTPRMLDFLQRASKAEEGKGILVQSWDARIAGRACAAGYGWMIMAPLKIFILQQKGRDALEKEKT